MPGKTDKIPTILLTGFLGAGKTTLLNRLIEHYESTRTVLLINEFGKIGIDGELLVAGNYEKIELNKGSLFCICVRTDFIAEVEKIADEIQPELLIIEATGLADTTEMEKMLALPTLIDKIQLQACICLVDCQNFYKIKDNLKAPASQVRSADLVLINKIDLVTEEQVENTIDAVREMSPAVPILKTKYAEFPLEALADINRAAPVETGSPGEGRPDLLKSLTLEAHGSFDQHNWEQFESLVKPIAMRLKGFIEIDSRMFHIDATAEQWELRPAENVPASKNRLVLIGQDFDEEKIQSAFLRLLK
ncbi:GTP-binding protein [candidate division KSB1 bacterium]|nr:GTP-binding protein [candidate division KSB1 bacterium]